MKALGLLGYFGGNIYHECYFGERFNKKIAKKMSCYMLPCSKIPVFYLHDKFRPSRDCCFVLSSHQLFQVSPCVLPMALSSLKLSAHHKGSHDHLTIHHQMNILLVDLFSFSAGQNFQGTSQAFWDFRC